MIFSKKKLCKVKDDETMVKVERAEELCEGARRVTKLGLFKNLTEECSSCNPQNESWISLSYGENKGISAWLPTPIETIFDNSGLIMNVMTFVAMIYAIKKMWRIIFTPGKR